MPADRLRTSTNLQGRQKSCSECARAKRRCDLGLPHCLRCQRQRLHCAYPSPPVHSATPASTDLLNNTDTIGLLADDIGFFDTSGGSTGPSGDGVDLSDFDFPSATASVDVLNSMLVAGIDTQRPLAHASGTTFDIDYLHGQTFSIAHIAPAVWNRIEFAIEHMKLAPALLVQEFRTHWCHPNLYDDEIPRCIQDVQAACALYESRNERNSTVVARHVIQRFNELLDVCMPSSPFQLLAHAQALILYQIMHLFGGDRAYYNVAEAAIEKLHSVSVALNAITLTKQDPSGSLPLYPISEGCTAWKSYIFRESARRSLIILVQVVAICNLFRGWLGECSKAVVAGNRVTFSAHLWNASNAFDFVMAWNDKTHYLVKELDFTELLERGRPDDVDVFGKMILTSVFGIDDMKGWFYTRGSTL